MNKKKTLALILVVTLLLSAIGGTLAYLTDTEEAVNTFTVGDVDIQLLESQIYTNTTTKTADDIREDAKTYADYLKNQAGKDVVPGRKFQKCIYVDNTGKNDAYYRVRMIVTRDQFNSFYFNENTTRLQEHYFTKSMFAHYADGTTKDYSADCNYDTGKTDFNALKADPNWTELEYVYTCEKILEAGQLAPWSPVDFFMMKYDLDNEDLEDLKTNTNIKVYADAIQAEGFADAEAAFAAFDKQEYADLTTLTGSDAQNLKGEIKLGALNATLTEENPDLFIGESSTTAPNLANSQVTKVTFVGGVINSTFKADTNIDSGANNDANIVLTVPNGCTVVFKDMTINGHYNVSTGSIGYYAEVAENVNVVFENCTINGCWVGYARGLKNITFKNCTFTLNGVDSTNTKDTNPLWIRPGTDSSTLTLDGCTIEGNRPIKFGERNNGHTLNVTNCTFNMRASEYDIVNNRPDRVTAVRFDTSVTTVNISGNTMNGGYAFYQTDNAPYTEDGYTDDKNTIADGILWRVEY